MSGNEIAKLSEPAEFGCRWTVLVWFFHTLPNGRFQHSRPSLCLLFSDFLWDGCVSDVCRVLEIENSSQAVSRLDDDEKGVTTNDPLRGNGGKQTCRTVNESGLYSLIFTSRKPQAKAFKRWVTKEVLPAIRKTGCYQGGEETPDTGDALTALESIAADSAPARLGLLNGTVPVETAQAIASLCAQGLRAWELRLRIKPEILPESLALTAPGGEMGSVLCAVADALIEDSVLSLADIFAIAQKAGVLSGELTPAIGKSLGRGLQRWRGHEFTDGRGRRCRMTRHRTKTGARYAFGFTLNEVAV